MEFYIQYEGRLPSQNSKDKENRRVETHRIRGISIPNCCGSGMIDSGRWQVSLLAGHQG